MRAQELRRKPPPGAERLGKYVEQPSKVLFLGTADAQTFVKWLEIIELWILIKK